MPGPLPTPAEAEAEQLRFVGMKSRIGMDEVADMVVHLASSAGRHITGTFNGYMMRANADTGGYGIAGRASFYQSNSPGNTAVGTSTITDGVLWHHLVATYAAGGNLNLYVDGGLQATIPSQTIISNSANFIVGGVFSTPNSAIINSFNGLIDELQMYDRVLSPAEVQFLNNNPGSAIPAPGAAAVVGLAGLLSARRRR